MNVDLLVYDISKIIWKAWRVEIIAMANKLYNTSTKNILNQK